MKIKNIPVAALIGTAICASAIVPVFAVPGLMNYQGKLTAVDGRLAADGSYEMAFAIHDQSSGGAALWTGTRDGAAAVPVTGGLFNVALGEVEPLDLPFDADYWLEVRVRQGGWQTLLPRQRIASAGYAFRAARADEAAAVAPGSITIDDLDTGSITGIDPSTGNAVIPVPVVSAVDPASMVEDYAPSTIDISGQYFQNGSRAKIGALDLTGEDVAGAAAMSAVVPAGLAPGTYDVRVCNNSFAWGTGAGLFEVVPFTPTPTPTPTMTPTLTPTQTPTITPTPTIPFPYTGLVSYYKLDETSGSTAVDSHGTHNGTANNSRVFTSAITGIQGTCADFSQADDIINFGNIHQGGTDMTLSVWFHMTASNTNARIFGRDPGEDGGGFIVQISGSYTDTMSYNVDGVWLSNLVGVSTNTWHHVVIVATDTTRKMYLNGSEVNSDTGTRPSVGTGAWTMGDRTSGAVDFTGYIDEAAVWSRALTEQEIDYLYSDGDGGEYY